MKDVIHQDYLTVEMTLTIKTNSYKLNNKMFIIVIVKCYWLFFLLLFYSISSSLNVVFFPLYFPKIIEWLSVWFLHH